MKFRNVSIQGNRRTDRNYERENGESYTCLTAEGDNFVGGAVKRAEFCGIEIKQVPTKKIYPRGYDGNFNLTGMILTALYNDTSKNRNIDVQGALDDGTLRVLPVDFSVIGVRKITLEYQTGTRAAVHPSA